MTTCRADQRAGYEQAGPDGLAGIDRIPQGDIGVAVGADIAQRGEASLQRLARIGDAGHRLGGNADAQALIAAFVGTGCNMGVHVDQARQDRLAPQVDPARIGWRGQGGCGSDRDDLVVLDDDGRRVDDLATGGIDEMRGGQIDRLTPYRSDSGDGRQAGSQHHDRRFH